MNSISYVFVTFPQFFIRVHRCSSNSRWNIYWAYKVYIDVCYARVKSRISCIPIIQWYLLFISHYQMKPIPHSFCTPTRASCQDWFHFKKYIWKAVSHIYYPTISWIEEFIYASLLATHGLIYFTHLRCHVYEWF